MKVGWTFRVCSCSIMINDSTGEHALYCLKENGAIKYMKKFDFNPSCFVPYSSVLEGTTNILVANHAATCFVFQDTMLVWSCKLSSAPVAMEVLTTGYVNCHLLL